jgi:magnesium chelatase family protein
VNAALTTTLMKTHCALDAEAERLLRLAHRRMGFSARGFDRMRKVARTIADLAGAERIGAAHVAEALQFRAPSP